MSSVRDSRLGAACLALTAAVVVAVASGDPGFLAVASPLLVALIPLVAGLFPGERAIERMALWIGRTGAGRSGFSGSALLSRYRPAIGRILAGSNGPRAPPLSA